MRLIERSIFIPGAPVHPITEHTQSNIVNSKADMKSFRRFLTRKIHQTEGHKQVSEGKQPFDFVSDSFASSHIH